MLLSVVHTRWEKSAWCCHKLVPEQRQCSPWDICIHQQRNELRKRIEHLHRELLKKFYLYFPTYVFNEIYKNGFQEVNASEWHSHK